jgi:HEXXH motif-containing protein
VSAGLSPAQPGHGVRPVGGSGPWHWQPPSAAWFARLHERAAHWEPSADLGLDRDLIRRMVQYAAAEHCRWLMHPCLNAMTLPRPDAKLQRDFQLAVWAAMHVSQPLGVATLERAVWAWAPGGGTRLEPGRHDLASLAARLAPQEHRAPLAIDPWARSIKVPFHQLWRDVAPFGPEEQATLKRELELLLRALVAAQERLPDAFAWVRSRSQVVVPLRKLSGEHASSSSASDLPGVVFLTLHNELQAIEALVHESAHQHLFTAEAAGALVDPDHTALYKSPLRDDPRSLRGVLLACHALAYIAAYYADALKASLALARALEAHLDAVRAKMLAAQDILVANREHLTAAGSEFVDRTIDVGTYSA